MIDLFMKNGSEPLLSTAVKDRSQPGRTHSEQYYSGAQASVTPSDSVNVKIERE